MSPAPRLLDPPAQQPADLGHQLACRFAANLDLFPAGRIPFAELDASVQGWINHVRYGDTRGLRRVVMA